MCRVILPIQEPDCGPAGEAGAISDANSEYGPKIRYVRAMMELSHLTFRVHDHQLTATDFLLLVQQVWPATYHSALIDAALQHTINLTVGQRHPDRLCPQLNRRLLIRHHH